VVVDEVWAIEAASRLTFVHTPFGRFERNLSLNSVEATCSVSLTRIHRNWRVNLKHVRELERIDGVPHGDLLVDNSRRNHAYNCANFA
jgi:DNA-binding LytR/AlgR family response regulator